MLPEKQGKTWALSLKDYIAWKNTNEETERSENPVIRAMHCPKSNPNFPDITRNVGVNETLHEIFCEVSRFPRYIHFVLYLGKSIAFGTVKSDIYSCLCNFLQNKTRERNSVMWSPAIYTIYSELNGQPLLMNVQRQTSGVQQQQHVHPPVLGTSHFFTRQRPHLLLFYPTRNSSLFH